MECTASACSDEHDDEGQQGTVAAATRQHLHGQDEVEASDDYTYTTFKAVIVAH